MLVGASLFMEMLDGTILANALPSMARDFGVAPVRMQVAMTAYLVAVAICIPASGWLASRIGARRLFTAALGLFTLSSFVCALSDSLAMLIAARAVQGVAGAMMIPVGRLLILRDLPKEQLVHAIAILTWPALLAPAIAPPLGGFIVEYASWHWVFLINIPLGLVGIALAGRLLPIQPPEASDPLDLTGMMFWAPTALMLVVVLGDLAQFTPAVATAALAATLLLMTLFVRHLHKARRPLLEIDLLADRNLSHTLYGGSSVRIAIFAMPFLLPMMMQLGLGMSPIDTGVLLLIATVGNIAMKPLTTPILQRFAYRTILLVNGALLTIGFALFAAVGMETARSLFIALLITTGMARSMHFTTLNTLAFKTISQPRMTAANTLFSVVMQMNAALGIAIAALALQLWPSSTLDPLAEFRFAFLVTAALALYGTLDALRLDARRTSAYPISEQK